MQGRAQGQPGGGCDGDGASRRDLGAFDRGRRQEAPIDVGSTPCGARDGVADLLSQHRCRSRNPDTSPQWGHSSLEQPNGSCPPPQFSFLQTQSAAPCKHPPGAGTAGGAEPGHGDLSRPVCHHPFPTSQPFLQGHRPPPRATGVPTPGASSGGEAQHERAHLSPPAVKPPPRQEAPRINRTALSRHLFRQPGKEQPLRWPLLTGFPVNANKPARLGAALQIRSEAPGREGTARRHLSKSRVNAAVVI